MVGVIIMKETFLLAPGINGSELLKSLAMQGVNCFNLRICNSVELAQNALLCSGITLKKEIITSYDETLLVKKAIESVGCFNEPQFADVQKIALAIKSMRFLISAQDEAESVKKDLGKGTFLEKNFALVEIYEKYIAMLHNENKIDGIGIIRSAINMAKPFNRKLLILKEFPLKPLEKVLAEKLFDGEVQEITLVDLFEKQNKNKFHIECIKKCYGIANEIESVISDIYDNNFCDRCTIAVSDVNSYGQIIYEYAGVYNLPITFGCGVSITNSRPAELLKLYGEWAAGTSFSKLSLKAILESTSFKSNELIRKCKEVTDKLDYRLLKKIVCDLRLTNIESENNQKIKDFKTAILERRNFLNEEDKDYADLQKKLDAIPAIEVISHELCQSISKFLNLYVNLRLDDSFKLAKIVDLQALNSINNEITAIENVGGTSNDILKAIPLMLTAMVAFENSAPGKIHVTSISDALTCIREKMFVVGLAASKYPGTPKENFLVLDEDVLNLNSAGVAFTSKGKIELKQKQLMALIELAAACDSQIFLSYAGLDVSELKTDNASSELFEIFKRSKGNKGDVKDMENIVKNIGYFDPSVSVNRKVGLAYIEGKRLKKCLEREKVVYEVPQNIDKAFSPSELEKFFQCPKRYMLERILWIKEPEKNDEYEVMSALDFGNLAHTLMERLGGKKSTISKKEFLDMAKAAFLNFLKEKPAVNWVDGKLNEFLQAMGKAYDQDTGKEVVLCEQNIVASHETGITLHGYPDRVEKLSEDKCMIVDFKTGANVVHVDNDINTCLQIVIYAFLMDSQLAKEGKKIDVSLGEYRYLRKNKVVRCKYDDDIKEALKKKLFIFKDAMKKGIFEITYRDQNCEYCPFADLCDKEIKK